MLLRKVFEDYARSNSVYDWYQVNLKMFDEKTSKLLQQEFKGSLYRALSTVFSEIEWYPWKFQKENVPQGYWKEQSNLRKFFDDLGKTIGIQHLDDWYPHKLSQKVIHEHGGGTIVTMYNGSPMAALRAAYPEHNWDFCIQKHKELVSRKKEQQRLDNIAELKTLLQNENLSESQWYQVSILNLNSRAIDLINTEFKGSLYNTLVTVFPEIEWQVWKFKQRRHHVKPGYWGQLANQRKFFDDLAKQNGIDNLDEWYQKISCKLIAENGGRSLLSAHKGSAALALMAAYPEHNWAPWKFTISPAGLWESQDNIKQFLAMLSERLCVQTLDDWYRVDWIQLDMFGATALLSKYKGLYNLLKEQYPHHAWDQRKFQFFGKKSQRWLTVTLKNMFPNEEILEDFMHPKAVFSSTNRPLQLDIFIPSKSLAFEYQGPQHYGNIAAKSRHVVFSTTRIYEQRDEEKRALCVANNIKLIEIPYWWNRTQESLQKIIHSMS